MAQECDSILEEGMRLVVDEEKDDAEMRFVISLYPHACMFPSVTILF